jgi:magnesium-transporting ATPase (P-type)
VRAAAAELAAQGLRVLAMAYREADLDRIHRAGILTGGLVLAGLQGMEDPVRRRRWRPSPARARPASGC